MSKPVVAHRVIDFGSLRMLSGLTLFSMLITISMYVLPLHRGHMTFRSAFSDMASRDAAAPLMVPSAALRNTSGPGTMTFPFPENAMLQFTGGRHVLGFRPKEVFLAGADHALKVEFLGARAVLPNAQGKPDVLFSSQRGGRPLGKVTYPDVWDGVTVGYEGSPGAVVKSTYYVAPRSARTGHTSSPVDQIRLRYNVPVRVDCEGNLVMSFETGEMCESAPVAWQEVGGKRIPVEVAYCVLGGKEVGFSVGNHEPLVPLVIDPKLTGNTFMGSSGNEQCNAIRTDLSGNVYVAGRAAGTWGTPINPHAGGEEGGARVRVIRADWQGIMAHLGLIALIAKCNYVGENCCVF